MRLPVISALALLIVTSATAWSADLDPKQATRPAAVIRAFNGRNLDGLVTWVRGTEHADPRKVFTVENGMLRISGDGVGYIRTKDNYRDYHLIVEFRWGGKTFGKRVERSRDSGVIVHCAQPDGSYHGVFMAGIEAQIIEGGTGDFIVCDGKRADGSKIESSLTAEITRDRDNEAVWQAGGTRYVCKGGRVNWYGRDPDWKDVLGFRGRQDVENPVGQWNRLEVICDGRRIEQRVNGFKVNEGFDAYPSAGQILIQTEWAEIYVRRWEICPLGKTPATPKGWKDGK